jgi:hypothetical protein
MWLASEPGADETANVPHDIGVEAFTSGHLRPQAELTGNVPDSLKDRSKLAGHVVTEDAYRSTGWTQESEDAANRCCLTRAVGAKVSVSLALRDTQRHVPHCLDSAVTLGQGVDLDGSVHALIVAAGMRLSRRGDSAIRQARTGLRMLLELDGSG